MQKKTNYAMINEINFFDKPVNNDERTYNIQKIKNDQADDDATGCQLDYAYFKEHQRTIAIDLRKAQVLDADPQKIN